MRWIAPLLLIFIFFNPTAFAANEFSRSSMDNSFWFEGSAGISPDSGVFHGEGSAVADRRDISVRYQPGIFGLIANWHRGILSWELEQESYNVNNRVFGAGFTLRFAPFGEKGGLLGGSHFVAYFLGQRGRSDYHYYEGPSSGVKSEVSADVVHAYGFSSGVDFYFPAFFGLWLLGGAGWESNAFDYKITTDPNDDGKVNIRQTFTYLRAGLAFSF